MISFAMKSRSLFQRFLYSIIGMILLVFVVGSCKKDKLGNGSTNYEMSFKASGTLVDYKTEGGLDASFNQTGNQYITIFHGSDANSYINLSIYDDKPTSETSYSGYTVLNSSITYGVFIGYTDSNGTIYTQPGGDVIIRVNSITANSASGTFSGTLKAAGKADLVITEGKFTLKRLN